MTQIGNLEFDYYYGACNSFSIFGILFCFGADDQFNKCFSMNVAENGTISIKNETSSQFPHNGALSMASYKGLPFITGSWQKANNKTEILNADTMRWEINADYPSTRFETNDII